MSENGCLWSMKKSCIKRQRFWIDWTKSVLETRQTKVDPKWRNSLISLSDPRCHGSHNFCILGATAVFGWNSINRSKATKGDHSLTSQGSLRNKSSIIWPVSGQILMRYQMLNLNTDFDTRWQGSQSQKFLPSLLTPSWGLAGKKIAKFLQLWILKKVIVKDQGKWWIE